MRMVEATTMGPVRVMREFGLGYSGNGMPGTIEEF